MDFLVSAFTPDGLRLVCMSIDPTLLYALPGPSASAELFALELVTCLQQRVFLAPVFFTALAAARPHRDEEVQQVRALWEVPADVEPAWLSELCAHLAPLGESARDHLDRTQAGVRRRLELAERHLRAHQVLTADEWNTFAAAVATWLLVTPDIAEAIVDDVIARSAPAPAVRQLVADAAADVVPVDANQGGTALRLGLVLALLRMTEGLACTCDLLAHPTRRPPDGADRGWWAMHLSDRWEELAPGVLRLRIRVPDRKWREALGGATALGAKVLWETLAPVLATTGIGLTFAPCDPRLSDAPVPPRSVLVGLRALQRDNFRRWPRLRHMSELQPIDGLLHQPLPISVHRRDLCFELAASPPRRVVIGVVGDPRPLHIIRGAGAITLELARLEPGVPHYWRIERSDGFGDLTVVTGGELLALPEALARQIGDDPHELARHGLWTELVQSWWPRRGKAEFDTLTLLLSALRRSHDWLQLHDTSSPWSDGLLDAIDELTALMDDRIGSENSE